MSHLQYLVEFILIMNTCELKCTRGKCDLDGAYCKYSKIFLKKERAKCMSKFCFILSVTMSILVED